MAFNYVYVRDDKIEICSREEGFVGSYYEATVVSQLRPDLYVVRYDRLFENDISAEPLVETVRHREIRPAPPPPKPKPIQFAPRDSVDAFDNDGWWVGVIVGRVDSETYSVLFETTGDLIDYPLSRLRPHLDWVRAKWVSPSKNSKVLILLFPSLFN